MKHVQPRVWVAAGLGLVAVVYGCAPDFDDLTSGRGGSDGAAGGGRAGAPGGGTAGSPASGGTAGASPVPSDSGAGGDLPSGGTPPTGPTAGAGGSPEAGAGGLGGEGGTPIVIPPCEVAGKALQLTAGAYVTVPRSVEDDFTIEAWIQTTTSLPGPYFYQGTALAWADTSDPAGKDFAITIVNGQVVANVGGSPDVSAIALSQVTTGAWVHVAMTRTMLTGAIQVYINGLLEATAVSNTSSLNSVPVVGLGSTVTRDTTLIGLMDEVRFWSVVRTQSQLLEAMHHPLSGSETGLAAYYRFDELVAGKLPDSSPNGRAGTKDAGATLVESNAPLCAPDGSGGAGGAGGQATGGAGGDTSAPLGGASALAGASAG